DSALVSGSKVFSVKLKRAATDWTVTASDTAGSNPLASDTSATVTVNPGAVSKLQVLLPGESADPGSATGKTGSPTAQAADTAFSVTVNAVDANWNLVASAAPTVHLATNKVAGYSSLPADAALSS